MLQPAAQTFQSCTSVSSPLIVSSCSSPSWSDVVDSHTSDADVAQDLNPMQSPSILHLSFNQDAGCFAVGTTDGFALFNTDPFGESLRRNSGLSGVGIVQMLFRSNILALVDTHGSSRNKVLIWDDRLNHCVFQLLFRSEVKAVRLRRDRIVVVMLQKIYVYDFFSYKLIHQIETQENPEGVCEISQTAEPMVLVCLGLQRGFVRVEQYATKQCKHVMAHNSSVAFVALMHDGRLMATASSKGTLIRVFSTTDGSLLRELRRGAERAVIFSLSFSLNAQWLAVSSDKGTVHVFSLKVESAQRNKCASRISFIKGVVPKYLRSEWSVAQFHIQEGLRHIVGFGQQENTISIVGYDGSFYRCQFDPVLGGEMTQLECHHFSSLSPSF